MHTHHLLFLTAVFVGACGCSDVERPTETAPIDTLLGDEGSDAGADGVDLPADPLPPRAPGFAVDHITVQPGELLPDLVIVSAYDGGELVAELTLTAAQDGEVLQGVADFPESWRRKRESLYTGATEHAAEGKPLGDNVDRFVGWLASNDADAGKTACECVAWLELVRPGETIAVCE